MRAIYGSPVGYADYREMLARERPDITVVASREIGDHHQIVMDVARSRSHVYLEKPVAASLAEVDDMIHACEAHDLTLVVAHPWRGHPRSSRWQFLQFDPAGSANPAGAHLRDGWTARWE